jgi:hypothetical protein
MKKQISILIVSLIIISSFSIFHVTARENEAFTHELISFSNPTLIEKLDSYILSCEDTNSYLNEPGKPMLPIQVLTYCFPSSSIISEVSCLPLKESTIPLSKPLVLSSAPVSLQTLQQTSADIDSNNDNSYPDSWYDYEIYHGLYHGKKAMVLKIIIYPFQYHQNADLLTFAEQFDIGITYHTNNNYLPQNNEQYNLLIISPIDFMPELWPLALHKEDRNIQTKLVSLTDIYDSVYFPIEGRDDLETIKYFIKNAYDNWNISNVLLVGGIEQIPSRETHIKVSDSDSEIFVSDLYFADLYDESLTFSSWDTNNNDIFAEYDWDGETDDLDLFPDVRIGRLPCINSDQVETIVNKIITYENTNAYSSDWFSNIVAIGGDTAPGDERGIDEGEYVNQAIIDLLDGFSTDIIWDSNDRLGGINPTGIQNINDGIEEGCGFLDFSGHGAPWVWTTFPHNGSRQILPTPSGSYTSNNIDELQNGEKLPIVLCGGCSLGKFSAHENCFAWAFLANPNGGGIASFGATGLGYIYIGEGVTYGLVEGYNVKIAEAYAKGALTFGEMWNDAFNNYVLSMGNLMSADYKTLEEYHPFGDPTLTIAGASEKPEKPNPPQGPKNGNVDIEYNYNATTIDPEEDNIYYYFEWGDGTDSGWLGPYASGKICTSSHSWSKRGSYQIRVKARDEHGSVSAWSDPLQISMPKNKSIQSFMQLFLDTHPNIYKIIEHLFYLRQ